MPPSHSQIQVGAIVSIVLKVDQPTGHQVQGTVADVLTSGDHPRGVKVRLTDGRIGRVQEVISPGAPLQQQQFVPPSDPQNWQAHTSYPGNHMSAPPPQPYGISQPQTWQAHTSFPSGHSHQQPPYSDQHSSQGQLINDPVNMPADERSEQVEYLQSYEDSMPTSEDDKNQAVLQKEFPNIDSSLIAAIYGDSKSLNATREMLQELKD